MDDLLDEAAIEHEGAKTLITEIQGMAAEDDLFEARVKVLAEQVRHHIKEEEGELFPRVRKSDMDLEALGDAIRDRKAELMTGAIPDDEFSANEA